MSQKTIGLLLGDEEDWPSTFEQLMLRLPSKYTVNGETVEIKTERIRIHPFSLQSTTRYNLVIDRLAYWHFNPREWLKKAALFNGTYLLNNPFTFQSMEKHSAYCAMMRLGLNVPETWLVPQKKGPEGEKYRITSSKYHDLFSLPEIGQKLGYPMFMKPFDGGGWRGVSRIKDDASLSKAYDESGQSLMLLQAGLEDYDVFVRSLGIGPQLTCLKYAPERPMHDRYVIDHNFLSAEKGREARAITKVINAIFRWDFNSCETILKNDILWPIDFANACPDVAVTSLHYYFPWAIKSLAAWSLFCALHKRPMHITMDIEKYFAIGDSDRSYKEKLDAYEALADEHFQTEAFFAFKQEQLPMLDEVMWELVQSGVFDRILLHTVKTTFPAHEHDKYIQHYRGLLKHWVTSEVPEGVQPA